MSRSPSQLPPLPSLDLLEPLPTATLEPLPPGVDDGRPVIPPMIQPEGIQVRMMDVHVSNQCTPGGSHGEYNIHDNGGNPFKVWVKGNDVIVKKPQWKKDKIVSYVPVLNVSNPLNIWIGKDTHFGEDGNTILVRKSCNRYMYIGERIHEFNLPDDVIKEYVSPLWGSDVAYGLGFGTHCTYFFTPCNRWDNGVTDYLRRIPNAVLLVNGFKLGDDRSDADYNALYDYYYSKEEEYFEGDHSLISVVSVNIVVPRN
jgi:hypothetical protein